MSGAAPDVASRVILVPASAPSREAGRASPRGGVLGALAALLAAVVVLAQSLAADAVQTGWALKTFPFWWGGQSEADRLFDKGWPAFEAAEGIAELVPPRERVLAFRQAEIAFYTRANYVFFFDAAVSPIFIMKDPAAAAAAFVDKGVRWIAAPDYAMPEIDNSAVGAIIADPRLAALVRDFGGFRLFRINDAPAPLKIAPAAEEAFSVEAPAGEAWRVLTIGGAADEARSAPAPDGRLEAVTPHALFGAAGETLQIERWRPPDRAIGDLVVDLSPTAPVFDISADLEGRGRAEIVLQTAKISDDSEGEPPPPTETPVWKGVLLGERRTVSGQFLVPEADFSDETVVGYRLVLRLRGPGRLLFGGWRAEAVLRPATRAARTSAASAGAGWTLDAAAAPSGSELVLRPTDDGGVSFELAPRATARLFGPWLIEPGLARRLLGDAAGRGEEAVLETLASALDVDPYEIAARLSVAGSGVAGFRLDVRCVDGAEKSSAVDLVQLSEAGDSLTIRTRSKCRPALARVIILAYGLPAGAAAEAATVRIGAPAVSLKVPGGAPDGSPFAPVAAALPELAELAADGGSGDN